MVPSWTQNIDSMFTSTWALRKTEAIEQAYMKTPFIYWLKTQGKIDNAMSGYTRIEIPLEYGSNETVRWIGKGSTVPLTEGELLTMAFESWKYVSVTIMRFGTEDHQNRGRAAIINYVERKIAAAERSLWEEFERVAFADGTGPNMPNGLQNLIPVNPAVGIVHGINRATYSWFRNQTRTASGPFSVFGISDMRSIMNTMTRFSKNEIAGLFLLTDQTTFEAYEDELLDYLRITDKTMTDLGFENLKFKGRPIMWAPSAPAARIYFINPQYLKLMIDDGYFMSMTDWKAIPDQVNDRTAQIVSAMNMVCSRPIAQGILTGITY
ncbi:MAG: hypothetical protein DDT18_00723 [Actinobacteria bacterium]|nr:hypothetical protein [Actinomycetota bacterium]